MDNVEELRKKLIGSARKKVQEKFSSKDVHIAKAVNLLEDIDAASNLLIEQLREWHAFHFPELNELVKDNDVYLKLVYSIGERKNFSVKKISGVLGDENNAQEIASAASNSMGSETAEKDLSEMKMLALNCLNLRQEREYLSKYLEESMKAELPNFSEIAGAVIGAKILAKAGSKERLAFMPASTIQIIGAEKALFMHFRKGVKGPKYGFLFQHPLIKAAPFHVKGKLARSLAAKLAIAVKADFFGKRDISAELKKSLEERARQLAGRKMKPGKKAEAPAQKAFPEKLEIRRNDFTGSWKARGSHEQTEKRNGYAERRGGDERHRPRSDGFGARSGGFRPRTGSFGAKSGGFGNKKFFGHGKGPGEKSFAGHNGNSGGKSFTGRDRTTGTFKGTGQAYHDTKKSFPRAQESGASHGKSFGRTGPGGRKPFRDSHGFRQKSRKK